MEKEMTLESRGSLLVSLRMLDNAIPQDEQTDSTREAYNHLYRWITSENYE